MSHLPERDLKPESAFPAAPRDEMLSRVLRAAFWMLNSNLVVRLTNLARGVVLARLLVPDDFGLFGLATIVIGFTAMFSDVGAGAFLVYAQDDVQDHVDTAFWANLGIASLLSIGVLGMAPLVARIYHRRELIAILGVLAVSLWLQTATTVHRNLVRRDLRFRSLAIVDASVSLTIFLCAVGMAWRGYGVWSFVVSTLAGNAISALLLFYIYPWTPRRRFSKISLRAIMPFSGWYVGQALVWYLVLNIDNLMVGKFLGIDRLGIYGLAYNYALMPLSLFGMALGNVAYAELPRLYQNPPRFWAAYFQYSKLLAMLVCPAAAILVVVAPDVIPLFFGAKWDAAIVPFQILAVYGAIRCLWIDPFGAMGIFRLNFWMAIVTLAISALGIGLVVRYGIVGVAWAVLVLVGGAHLSGLYIATGSVRKTIEAFRGAAPYFTLAAVAAILAMAVRHQLAYTIGNRSIALSLVSTATVCGVYGGTLQRELRTYIRALKGNSAGETCAG